MIVYGKCSKIPNTLFHTFKAQIVHFMQLFLKILSGMKNSLTQIRLLIQELFVYAILSKTLVYKILVHLP